jgi:protein-tyrosine-phosphatase
MATADDLTVAQQHLILSATARLRDEFGGMFSAETIQRFISESMNDLLPTATVTAFLPIFVERFARDRLKALAKVEGKIVSDRPTVLFLCTHNAGRSQMAAAWMRHLSGDKVSVYSGGSEPASHVNPAAIETMAEVGIDMRTEFPKPWTDEIVRAADVVITMGCGDACPLYPGKRYEDWEISDPQEQDVVAVRPIRDEIKTRVERLISDLGVVSMG